ncbi:Retrovirus-related Pol polyprotein from transposon TNT 1-94 [Lachnellula cervina]|uniref:Retrovirus-related Pol polyprotein from transposon TNT 1-94 n=1 Tax=Lachnellula cervina TaxID=1316786 RepID=A0A7D8YMS4_9HELO|nr:Retrovirus-related Pol polyprotein from transposon TNT 1-94 [Lachnellula cervina]
MAAITSYKGEALVGRSNYIEWLKEASLFLEVHGFMPYIDSTEKNPLSIKSLYYTDSGPRSPELAIKYLEKETEYSRNTKRALGAIKSTLSANNIDRFKDQPTADLLWAAIKATFGETSLETIARYFNKLIDASYESFKSADEYTSYIQSSAIYLKELGYELPKPFIAILLFKGLSSSFDAFSSRKYKEVTKNIKNIDITKLISDIISEEARLKSDTISSANKTTSNKIPLYRHCGKRGHIEPKCWDKYPELRTEQPRQNRKSRSNNTPEKTESTKAVIMTLASYVYNGLNNYKSKFYKTQLILDLGASEHYTYNKDWLLDYKPISNKSIRIANGQSLAVLGKGDILVKANNNTELIIKDVFYVPNLRANLISTKELINKGWNIIFKKDLVEIVKNTIRVTASWRYNAYYLNMLVDFNELEPIVYYTKPENNKLDLYHRRLNHLNKDILLKTIDNTSGLSLGNNEASNNSISDCEPCFIGKFHNIGSKKPMSTAPVLSVYDIDIAGPIKPLGLKGEKYFMTITDRGSRGAWVFPINSLKHKLRP